LHKASSQKKETMFHIVLFEPEIPPNTGNIIRLCANTATQLHLIEPMGFALNDAKLKRAGLDYHEFAKINVHKDYASFLQNVVVSNIYACSTKGKTVYSTVAFKENDALLFGPESRGLPKEVLQSFNANHIITIPMQPESRSLNLSNSVAIILYEAWRQNDFRG
jgi:tRNA (cytidine/uridine-2'-O-)-methyltransferase